MRNRKLAAMASGVLILGVAVGLGAASAPLRPATMPPISSAGHVEIDQLKILSGRVDKLETEDAHKNAQIATLTQQLAGANATIQQLQGSVAGLQAQMANTVPATGPGNCTSHGYTNAASLPANPGLLVYTWGTCKAQ